MKASLTDRWGSWLEAAGPDCENMVHRAFVRNVIVRELRNDGFQVPSSNNLESTLSAGLEALSYRHPGFGSLLLLCAHSEPVVDAHHSAPRLLHNWSSSEVAREPCEASGFDLA